MTYGALSANGSNNMHSYSEADVNIIMGELACE